MKKERLYSPDAARYATIAVIMTGGIASTLGVRDSLIFGGVRPILIVGAALVAAGVAVLVLTYRRAEKI